MELPSKLSKMEPSTKSVSMTSSVGTDALAARYPWVKPEVWETPMNSEEFRRFVAKQEELLKE